MLFSSILQSAVNYFIPPKPLDWRNRDLKHSQVTVAGSIFEVNVPIQSTAAMNLTILLCFWRLITQVDLSISWCCYNIFLGVFLVGWLWLVVGFFFVCLVVVFFLKGLFLLLPHQCFPDQCTFLPSPFFIYGEGNFCWSEIPGDSHHFNNEQLDKCHFMSWKMSSNSFH